MKMLCASHETMDLGLGTLLYRNGKCLRCLPLACICCTIRYRDDRFLISGVEDAHRNEAVAAAAAARRYHSNAVNIIMSWLAGRRWAGVYLLQRYIQVERRSMVISC